MTNVRTTNSEYSTKNVYMCILNFMIYDDMTGRKKYIVDQNYSAVEKISPYVFRLITRSKNDSTNNPYVGYDEHLKQLSLPLERECFIDKLKPISSYVSDSRITKKEIENILSMRNGVKPISKGISKVKSLWN